MNCNLTLYWLIQWKCNLYLEMLVIETRFMHEIKVCDDILLSIPVMYWEYFTKKREREREKYAFQAVYGTQKLILLFTVWPCLFAREPYPVPRVWFYDLFNTITLTTLSFPRGTSHLRFLIKILCPLFTFFVRSTRLARVFFLYFIARHDKEYTLRIVIMQYWHSIKVTYKMWGRVM